MKSPLDSAPSSRHTKGTTRPKGKTVSGNSGVPVQGALIRELRILAGLSGVDFATACAVSAQHVSDMELGKRGASPRVLKRMATVLEVAIPTLRADAVPA